MGCLKTLGSGLVAALAVLSLPTGAIAQALPVFVGPGQTYVITTPETALIANVGGAIDIQAPGGDLTLVGSSSNFADVGGTGGTLNNSGALMIDSSAVLDNYATITSSGTFTNTGTLNNQVGGTLGGSGLIGGNVTVDGGTVGPGNSPGQLYLFGEIDFLTGSTFAAELGGLAFGTDYDRLDVSGTASLAAGTMFDIDFFGAFTAGLGDTFDVLVADDIQAALLSTMLFDFTGAALGSGLAWDFGIVDFGGGRDSLGLSVIEGGIAAIPAPAAALLFGLGLFGIGFTRRFQGRRRAI